METTGPALWLIVLTIGVALLGGAIAYGIARNRKRSRGERALTEAATRREYERQDRDAS